MEDSVAFKDQDREFELEARDWLAWSRDTLPEPYGVKLTAGGRRNAEQYSLFKKGRKKVKGFWKIVKRWLVVTFCDGKRKRSPHQRDRKTGWYKAIDFVITFHGHPIWYPRDDDKGPEARTVRELYRLLCKEARKRGLESGHFWKRLFDPYHIQKRRGR